MAKLTGAVVYRERVGKGFSWAVRVYSKGSILFQSAKHWERFDAALNAAKLVAIDGVVTVYVGPASCQLPTRHREYKNTWFKDWIASKLKKEAEREAARQRRLNRRLQRVLGADTCAHPAPPSCKANLGGTQTYAPLFFSPTDYKDR